MELGLDWGLKPGESAETDLYLTGLFEEEVDIDEYLDKEGKVDLSGLDEDDLLEMASAI